MKRILILSALALSACTATPQMIEAQKAKCSAIGYAQGTTHHAACVERGTFQQEGAQNAGAAVSATIVGTSIIGALLY